MWAPGTEPGFSEEQPMILIAPVFQPTFYFDYSSFIVHFKNKEMSSSTFFLWFFSLQFLVVVATMGPLQIHVEARYLPKKAMTFYNEILSG